MRCSICLGAADYGPIGSAALSICSTCALLVADLARVGDGNVWSGMHHAPVHVECPALLPHPELERFKFEVSALVGEKDAESHSNLARAYREMDLLAEAVREAGIALSNANKSTSMFLLEMLLTPPVLRVGGFEKLKARVRALSRA